MTIDFELIRKQEIKDIVKLRSGKYISELYPMYAVRGMQYHGISHISTLLKDAEDIAFEINMPAQQLVTLIDCIWFHDSYYDPTAKEGLNERLSAGFAVEVLNKMKANLWVDTDTVERAILCSAKHLEIQDVCHEVALFLDLDLLGFSKSDTLHVNEKSIRAEYSLYSDVDFRQGRYSFLCKLLKRAKSGLYYSPCFKGRDEIALENIAMLTTYYR